jgi:signal transduction histidine kinase
MAVSAPRLTLTRQLLGPLVLLVVTLAAAIIGLGWWQMTRQLEAQLLQRARTIARTLQSSGEAANSREEMTRLSRTLVAGGDVELVAVAGQEPQRLLVASRLAWQGRRLDELPPAEVDPAAVRALQQGREYARLAGGSARFCFVGPLGVDRLLPLRNAQVLLVLNVAPLQAQIADSLRLSLAGLAMIGVLGAAGFAWLLRARVLRPLSALAATFGRPGTGGEPPPAPPGLAREIATLGEALAAAFGQVRELNRELEQRVRDRTAELVASLDRERELGRLRTNFVSLVSHEYRNAVATILSSAQILERYRERLTAEERAQHLVQITSSCHRLAALVDDVLLYSRSESGRLEVNLAPFDLAALARAEAAEAARLGGAADRIVLRSELASAPGASDEQLLHHVLSNLLGNAVKYSPPDRPVEFNLRREGDTAVFTVRDRGIGIPADELPEIGTAFRRARNVAEVPGTGLGLVMVRRCVELLGGTLQLESVLGEGTTATVTVPVFRTRESAP